MGGGGLDSPPFLLYTTQPILSRQKSAEHGGDGHQMLKSLGSVLLPPGVCREHRTGSQIAAHLAASQRLGHGASNDVFHFQ